MPPSLDLLLVLTSFILATWSTTNWSSFHITSLLILKELKMTWYLSKWSRKLATLCPRIEVNLRWQLVISLQSYSEKVRHFSSPFPEESGDTFQFRLVGLLPTLFREKASAFDTAMTANDPNLIQRSCTSPSLQSGLALFPPFKKSSWKLLPPSLPTLRAKSDRSDAMTYTSHHITEWRLQLDFKHASKLHAYLLSSKIRCTFSQIWWMILETLFLCDSSKIPLCSPFINSEQTVICSPSSFFDLRKKLWEEFLAELCRSTLHLPLVERAGVCKIHKRRTTCNCNLNHFLFDPWHVYGLSIAPYLLANKDLQK